MENIGGRIKKLREERGVSQNELARRAGISQSGLSSLENETKSPTVQTIGLIAKALSVSISEILDENRYVDDVENAQENAAAKEGRKLLRKWGVERADGSIDYEALNLVDRYMSANIDFIIEPNKK